jgi:hypothetical protein
MLVLINYLLRLKAFYLLKEVEEMRLTKVWKKLDGVEKEKGKFFKVIVSQGKI